MMKPLFLIGFLAVFAAGCKSDDPFFPTAPSTGSAPYSVTDLRVGTGPAAVAGQRATFTYTGWLYSDTAAENKGTQFDTGTNVQFQLGTLIQAWNLGIPGMRVGGLRRIVAPPELAYGNNPPTSAIPRNATLLFEVELVSVP
jgi:FKBP-type peptidyl-prolyl cis-trans isomerase FkpA